eukprot:Nk52_evm33s307 gene=Nk52_evmTU33s307
MTLLPSADKDSDSTSPATAMDPSSTRLTTTTMSKPPTETQPKNNNQQRQEKEGCADNQQTIIKREKKKSSRTTTHSYYSSVTVDGGVQVMIVTETNNNNEEEEDKEEGNWNLNSHGNNNNLTKGLELLEDATSTGVVADSSSSSRGGGVDRESMVQDFLGLGEAACGKDGAWRRVPRGSKTIRKARREEEEFYEVGAGGEEEKEGGGGEKEENINDQEGREREGLDKGMGGRERGKGSFNHNNLSTRRVFRVVDPKNVVNGASVAIKYRLCVDKGYKSSDMGHGEGKCDGDDVNDSDNTMDAPLPLLKNTEGGKEKESGQGDDVSGIRGKKSAFSGDSFWFTFGKREVIQGVEIAVKHLLQNSKMAQNSSISCSGRPIYRGIFRIHPNYGYGDCEDVEGVPPGSVLLLSVAVMDFKPVVGALTSKDERVSANGRDEAALMCKTGASVAASFSSQSLTTLTSATRLGCSTNVRKGDVVGVELDLFCAGKTEEESMYRAMQNGDSEYAPKCKRLAPKRRLLFEYGTVDLDTGVECAAEAFGDLLRECGCVDILSGNIFKSDAQLKWEMAIDSCANALKKIVHYAVRQLCYMGERVNIYLPLKKGGDEGALLTVALRDHVERKCLDSGIVFSSANPTSRIDGLYLSRRMGEEGLSDEYQVAQYLDTIFLSVSLVTQNLSLLANIPVTLTLGEDDKERLKNIDLSLKDVVGEETSSEKLEEVLKFVPFERILVGGRKDQQYLYFHQLVCENAKESLLSDIRRALFGETEKNDDGYLLLCDQSKIVDMTPSVQGILMKLEAIGEGIGQTAEDSACGNKWKNMAEKYKRIGSSMFKEGRHSEAIKFYQCCIFLVSEWCRSRQEDDDESKGLSNDDEAGKNALDLYIACYANITLMCIKAKEYKNAIVTATKALLLQPDNIKCLYRRGLSHLALENLPLAKRDLSEALKLDPASKEIRKDYNTLVRKMKVTLQKEKKVYANMFSS